jgi:hypothetical protein
MTWPENQTSWLVLVNVWPVPEESEARIVFDRIVEIVDEELEEYEVDLSAVYAKKVSVVSLQDLDDLPEVGRDD